MLTFCTRVAVDQQMCEDLSHRSSVRINSIDRLVMLMLVIGSNRCVACKGSE